MIWNLFRSGIRRFNNSTDFNSENITLGWKFDEVDVMRVLLDHELLTLREAQRFLNVNRCTINEMIDTGKLHAIKIGSQWKIKGWSLKSLLPGCHSGNFNNDLMEKSVYIDASDSELSMIMDWT